MGVSVRVLPRNNLMLSKLTKTAIIKGEALVSALLFVLSFILSPIMGVFVAIYKLFDLNRISHLKKISDVMNSTIIDEILWVIVALIAGTFVPLPVGIVLILWRALMLYKAISAKRRV